MVIGNLFVLREVLVGRRVRAIAVVGLLRIPSVSENIDSIAEPVACGRFVAFAVCVAIRVLPPLFLFSVFLDCRYGIVGIVWASTSSTPDMVKRIGESSCRRV